MRHDEGFSLIEVLCAMTVAALGLVLLMQMHAASIRLDGRLDADSRARRIASGKLAVAVAGSSGESGLDWRFDRVVASRDADSKLLLVRESLQVRGASGAPLLVTRLVLEPAP